MVCGSIFRDPGERRGARKLTNRQDIIKGLAWLPDGSDLSMARAAAARCYAASVALWELRLQSGLLRQITSTTRAKIQTSTAPVLISAARMQMRFDIWKFPFEQAPIENVRRARPG
jgi:hypothetical protein